MIPKNEMCRDCIWNAVGFVVLVTTFFQHITGHTYCNNLVWPLPQPAQHIPTWHAHLARPLGTPTWNSPRWARSGLVETWRARGKSEFAVIILPKVTPKTCISSIQGYPRLHHILRLSIQGKVLECIFNIQGHTIGTLLSCHQAQ